MNKSRKFVAFILITLILSGFAGKVMAQIADEEEPHGLYVEKPKVFYAGLLAGANFSQIDGDYYAGYHKVGLNVGGIAYAQIAKHVALSMEILYSQKGSKSDGAQSSKKIPDTYILDYGINNNYAEIPVMINYFDKRKSHFGVGVSYSRLISSNETLHTIDTSNVVQSINLNNLYPFKKNSFDVLAGVELHLWQGLFLNVRFQYSITPVRATVPANYARSQQYNNLWVVRLMYLFI